MMEVKVETRGAFKQIEKLTGPAYTEGKFRGFKAMAEVVRDRAAQTKMFEDKTGTLRKRWRIRKKKFRNRDGTMEFQAHLRNVAPHAHLIIYGRRQRGTGPKSKPRPFIKAAARETGPAQLKAAGKAMLGFLKEVERENPGRA